MGAGVDVDPSVVFGCGFAVLDGEVAIAEVPGEDEPVAVGVADVPDDVSDVSVEVAAASDGKSSMPTAGE